MNDQPSTGELKPGDYGCILGDSEDSEEELSVESVLESSWENLPMLERLGLSSMPMTEEEVEDSFVQLALAFRCDQYTLVKRLQAEEHDHAVAEENLHQELEMTKDTLQSLKVRCQDRERTQVLEKLELCLENIGGTIEGIATAAEQLGTVHQEARVTRAVELMASHVQSLSRRHAAESSELEETRRLVHRTRGRMYSDSTDDGDMRHCLIRQPSQQYLTRRRVSVTLIPTVAQINDLESKLSETVSANGDTDSTGSENAIGPGSSREISPKTCLPKSLEDCPPPQKLERPTNGPQIEEDPVPNYIKSPLQDTLCRLRKCVAAKDAEEVESEGDQGSGVGRDLQFSDTEQVSPESSIPLSEVHPLVAWLSHNYWTLLWIFMIALYLVILLGVLLWYLRAPLLRL